MSKRILSIILSTVIFLSSLSAINFCAYASNFTYSLISDNEICITKYVGNETDVEIPDTIDGYSVTKIGDKSFRNTSAKTVVIPKGVREIGNSVFQYLHLTSVTLPDSLETIGDSAFESNYIESIDLPCSLKTIGNRAFANTDLKNLNLPFSVENIGKSAFIGDEFLVSINVDENNQFYSSENNILYNKDKTQLILYAARNETAKLILPDTVKEIFNNAFGKAHIQEIVLPDGLETIDDYAFCFTELSKISIPDSVKSIGSYVFDGCSQLTNAYFGKGLETIGKAPFDQCHKLQSISVSPDNECFSSVDGVLFGNKLTELIRYPAKKSGKYYKIPDSVTTIKERAFAHCYSIYTLDLNNVEICEDLAIYAAEFSELILPSKLSKVNRICVSRKCSITVLNPECSFSLELSSSGNYDITIYGYKNSTAQAFVENNTKSNCMLTFVPLDDIEPTPPDEPENHQYTFEVFNPTCTQQGYTVYTCVKCGDTYRDNYKNKLGHTIIIDKEVAATCTKSGLTQGSHCSRCNKVIVEQVEIKASGHSMDDGVIKTNPTCAKNGEQVFSCKNCNYSYSVSIPSIGHKYIEEIVKPDCTNKGYTKHTCSRCGNTYKDNYKNELGHSIITDKAVAATCTKSGLTQGSHCSRCNKVIVEQVEIKASGHSMNNGVIKVKATCTNKGTKVFSCKNCDYSYNVSISATGHKYKSKTTKATLTKAGSAVSSCSTCGNVKSKSTIAKIKSVTISKKSLTYTGKNLSKPTVTVKDSKGNKISSKYYSVQYISRSTGKAVSSIKNIGQYKLKVTFKGNYSGEKYLYFSVKPKKIKAKAPSTGSKYVTAKWTKDNSISGYQVVIATDSKFCKNVKTVTISKNSTASYKFTKLKKGTKYYIKVRSYKTIKVDGRTAKMYSDYSTVKSIKCK